MGSLKFIALPIFLLVFASGCVLPDANPFNSQTPLGTGVVIESFGPDYPEAYSGEEVKFSLKVKNTGSSKANDISAELLMDHSWQPAMGGKVECGKDTTLLPADPESGITGGEETCTWTYTAPPVGLPIQSKAKVSFLYSYTSSTIKAISLISREELKVLQQQGKGLPTESYSKTDSPVSFDIETASPIRTYTNKVEFPIIITARNVGGGTVCSSVDDCKESDLGTTDRGNVNTGMYVLNFEIKADGMQLRDCGNIEDRIVVLIGNTPQSISCKIETTLPADLVGVLQKNIEVRAAYGYFITKTADITVRPSNFPG